MEPFVKTQYVQHFVLARSQFEFEDTRSFKANDQ